MSFISKQFLDVIQWTEPTADILAFRYPMEDKQIQTGSRLVVRESQAALFVNEGKVADVFGPGTYRLTTQTLPLLTNLNNWDKLFQSPFKSDVYFFSTRLQTNQHWGTTSPIVFREQEFGAIRLRGFGIYSYLIKDVQLFHRNVPGTMPVYTVPDLEGQLKNSLVGLLADTLAASSIPALDLTAHQVEISSKMLARGKEIFGSLGLELVTFVIQSLSLPEELQRRLDEKIGIKMVGDLGNYTKFQIAQSIPIAAANEGNAGVSVGAGVGMGIAMAQQIATNLSPNSSGTPRDTKFCIECGRSIPGTAKFCPDCGKPQIEAKQA
jgi:membrane protease subunit (stomatin/prohibitin family)